MLRKPFRLVGPARLERPDDRCSGKLRIVSQFMKARNAREALTADAMHSPRTARHRFSGRKRTSLEPAVEDQARGLRHELGNSLKGFQELTLTAFGTLRDGIDAQVRGFGERLDGGLSTGPKTEAGRARIAEAQRRRWRDYRERGRQDPSGPALSDEG
jgi:hypothetical protein